MNYQGLACEVQAKLKLKQFSLLDSMSSRGLTSRRTLLRKDGSLFWFYLQSLWCLCSGNCILSSTITMSPEKCGAGIWPRSGFLPSSGPYFCTSYKCLNCLFGEPLYLVKLGYLGAGRDKGEPYTERRPWGWLRKGICFYEYSYWNSPQSLSRTLCTKMKSSGSGFVHWPLGWIYG